MKTPLTILSVLLAACAVHAELLIEDAMEPSGWTLDGSLASFTASEQTGALTPTRGANFMYFRAFSGGTTYWNASAAYDADIVLAAGTYTYTIDLGDGPNSVFLDASDAYRLSIGLYDNATVQSGANIRNAIQSFNGGDGIAVIKKTIEPASGYLKWVYVVEVATNSPLIGDTFDFGIGWNSGGDSSKFRATAVDNLTLEYTPYDGTGTISCNSGDIATGISSNFTTKGEQAVALGAWMNAAFTNGAEISISGRMEMQGSTAQKLWSDRVGFAFCHTTSDFFSSVGNIGTQADYALGVETSLLKVDGSQHVRETLASVPVFDLSVPAPAVSNLTVNYAINLTFPTNWYDGVTSSNGHIYGYTCSLDFDRDGSYDCSDSGEFGIAEDDRVRFGFIVRKDSSNLGTESALTNIYTYVIKEGHMDITPPVTEIGDVSIEMIGSDAVISWPGINGVTYALQRKLDLSEAWSNIVVGVSGSGTVSATNAADQSAAFYRVTLE